MRTRGTITAALKLAVVQTLVVPTLAFAAADQKTLCVLRATEALPKLAGLKVTKSGTRPMPPAQIANWRGQSKPIIVDIDTNTPDVGQRY